MRGRALRFLADIHVSPLTVASLQEQGYDIVRSSHYLSAKATDPEVLALAQRERDVLVTQDLDFSALLALRGLARPSLITLRLSDPEPQAVARRLLQELPSLEQALREGCAVTIEDEAVRIRKLPIR